MRRIAVVGTSGSGKTTLARSLADRLGVPHIEMDALYHRPNWTHVSEEELLVQVDSALVGDGWVVDGNYGTVRDIAWGRADAVVWLDFPRRLVMRRVLRRTVLRGITRRELWHGNRERLGNIFTLDPEKNIVMWAWTTHERNLARYQAAFESDDWADKILIRLKTAGAARRFVAAFDGSELR